MTMSTLKREQIEKRLREIAGSGRKPNLAAVGREFEVHRIWVYRIYQKLDIAKPEPVQRFRICPDCADIQCLRPSAQVDLVRRCASCSEKARHRLPLEITCSVCTKKYVLTGAKRTIYVRNHSYAHIKHSMCPDCIANKRYKELRRVIKQEKLAARAEAFQAAVG